MVIEKESIQRIKGKLSLKGQRYIKIFEELRSSTEKRDNVTLDLRGVGDRNNNSFSSRQRRQFSTRKEEDGCESDLPWDNMVSLHIVFQSQERFRFSF